MKDGGVALYLGIGVIFGLASGGYIGRGRDGKALYIWYVLGLILWPLFVPIAIIKALFKERE